MRLFVVNFRFVYCGDVFTDGLRHAAEDLGLVYEGAYWNDEDLQSKIKRFRPDLVFVVHGRKFAQKWGRRFGDYRSAVWLVDEPYETDDTARWSSNFDTVFINDASTLHRHRNAHYLPMAFDPHVHYSDGSPRIYRCGFVGNRSAERERYLSALASAGLLDYVVGERWRGSALNAYCIAGNVPPERTAALYRQTRIVVNIFRETQLPATAMNPRIYEALACGAAVMSERRAGIADAFPALAQFESPDELVDRVRSFNPAAHPVNMSGHEYRYRLAAVLTRVDGLIAQEAA